MSIGRKTLLILSLLAAGQVLLALGASSSGEAESQAGALLNHKEAGHPTGAGECRATCKYSGHWEALGHPDGLDFDLHLQQRGAKISGHHMAVNADGTRIDGYTDGEPPSVDGEIKSGSQEVELQFQSSFATTTGKAKIKLRGKRLIWTVTSPPNGDYYLPGEAVLVRTGS